MYMCLGFSHIKNLLWQFNVTYKCSYMYISSIHRVRSFYRRKRDLLMIEIFIDVYMQYHFFFDFKLIVSAQMQANSLKLTGMVVKH